MVRRTTVALASVGAVAGAVMAAAIGSRNFERRISGEVKALLAAAAHGSACVIDEAALADLPEPVQRWLRWAQVIGKPLPAIVRLRQEGRFRPREGAPWMPFTAEEHFTTDPPGFLWKTAMRVAPLLSIVGRDRYAEGQGSIEMRLLGLIPVARADGPELSEGALLRYLNETMWLPAAALSSAITWEAIDATSARATIHDHGMAASAVFSFDEEGRPVDMVAERYDLSKGRRETWSTPLHAYGEFAGVRMPVAGQGVWHYGSGDFPYIELRIIALEYLR